MKRRHVSGIVVVVGCVVLALAGCANAPPDILEAAIVTDTSVEAGPYEARLLVVDDDGIGPSELRWSLVVEDAGAGQGIAGDGASRGGTVPLVPVGEERAFGGGAGVRLSGKIPGQPLGSLVRWRALVCDPLGACALAPAAAGTAGGDEAFEFRVGLVPSSPALDGVTPDVGPASGGTRVELRGVDLRPGARVFFGDVEAAGVEWLRADLVAAITAPAEPGTVDVRLENPDGAGAGFADAFTFVPSPVVEGVEPASGPTAGGTAVQIRGQEIVEGSRAFFDGVPCRGQRRVDDTLLECTTPPGRAGRVDVEIRHEDRGVGVLSEGFEYVPAPLVDVVAPDEGSSDGGNVITIGGDHFSDGAVVLVGGAECLDVVVVSASEITCVTPPGEPGVTDVVVINPDGQEGVLPGGFGFLGPPVIVEVVPGEVPVAGGIEVRVLGAGLDPSDVVTFGGAAGVVVGSSGSGELVVVVPPVPAALEPAPLSGLLAVDVVARRTRPDDTRTGTLEGGLVYFWPPEIAAVIPPRGPTAGGTEVVIVGRFFRPLPDEDFLVSFDGAPCASVHVLSSTSVACTTPPGDPGEADVEVQNHPLSVGTGEAAYFYVSPPVVEDIAPAEGPTFGGEIVVVRGRFFQDGALVFIDGAPCSGVTFVSAEEIRCTTPPGEEGPADVRVVNIDGQEDTAPGIYAYLGVAVTPDHGLPAGFTRVRVRSAGIQPGALVFFDATPADCAFVSSREMSCQTPAHAAGPVSVRFQNPDGTGEDGADAFDYRVLVDRSNLLESGPENITHVELADLDGDGDLDVVGSAGRVEIPETSSVWENRLTAGGGSFVEHRLPVDATANKVSVGDTNGDGRPDLLFAGSNGVGAILLENGGALAFSPVALALPPESSAFEAQLIDVVGDARLDIYVLVIGCSPFDPQSPQCDPALIGPDVVLEQQNNGFVDRSSLVPHDADWTHDHKLVATDLDLDGDNDIVIVTNNEGVFGGEENRVLENRVDEGRGFVVQRPPDLLGLIGDLYDIDAADVDGDGDPDVSTTLCDPGAGSSEALLRNDGGTLVLDEDALPSGPAGTDNCDVGTAFLDLDGDGDVDLLYGGTVSLADTRTQMKIYVNDGTGTFHDASAAAPAFGQTRLQLNTFAGGDVDRDGDTDVVVAGGAPYAETDRPGRVLVLRLE